MRAFNASRLLFVVVIEPDGTRTLSNCGNASFGSHVTESAVAIVVIQDVAAVLSDKLSRNRSHRSRPGQHPLRSRRQTAPVFPVTSVRVPS
jgi:hypothetical protein